MKQIAISILALLMWTSCEQKSKQSASNPTPRANVKEISKNDTVPEIIIPQGTVQVSYADAHTVSKIHLLNTADYNKQDIDPQTARLTWQGLFYKNDHDFYIAPTKISFTPQHSEMDGNANEKTGWHVTCDIKDKNISLISGTHSLTNGPVKKALLSTRLNGAGEKLEFTYYGVTYTLYTTGEKRNGKTYNYKLFLLAKVKGRYFNQQLLAISPGIVLGSGDMAEDVSIDFAGDLDGDKIPDFIIVTSRYSYGDISLYLSKSAGNKAILKQVSYMEVSD